MWSKNEGSKGDGYLNELGEPRGAVGDNREYWGWGGYLPAWTP